MCEPSPVRKVLEKFSVRQVESARGTALERESNARKAGDKASAAIFQRIAHDCSAELEDRLLTIATRDVLRESGDVDRQARDLLRQMST